MGAACTKSNTFSPTRKAQEFVQTVHADSRVQDQPILNDDHVVDDHIERALFPPHPAALIADKVPDLPRTCATVTSSPHAVLLEL